MTDNLKPTEKAKSTVKVAMDELREHSEIECIARNCRTVEEAAKYLAERFNGIRAELSTLISLMRSSATENKAFAQLARAVTSGDYGLLLDKSGEGLPKNFDVEDAGKFSAKVKELMDMRKPENRMRLCIELNDKIADAIEGWRSKVEKMKGRNRGDGATANELDVIGKKIVQFETAIDILRKRGGQVSDIYLATKRELVGFIEKSDRAFKVIYFNERV